MKSYKMRLSVSNFCMSPNLSTLDATIAGMVPDGDVSSIFDFKDGVALASCPVFTISQIRTTGMLRSVEKHLRDHEHLFREKERKQTMGTFVGSHSQDYHRGTPKTVIIPEKGRVDYYFTGDADQVVEALETHRAIGSWASRGFGTLISDYSDNVVSIIEVEHPLCGILGPEGELLRPVPLAMAKTLGVSDYEPEFGRYQNPYIPFLYKQMKLPVDEIAMPRFAMVA